MSNAEVQNFDILRFSGKRTTGSDVDFGLLLQPGETLSALEINDLVSELTLDLGRPVDIGLISARNLIFARQCVLTGTQIFCRDVFRAPLTVH